MKKYIGVTWEDIGMYGHIRPIAGLDAVSTIQVAEFLNTSAKEVQKLRTPIMDELKQLGMFTASAKQIAQKVKHTEKMDGCRYLLWLDNGETTIVPCGPIVYYPAPAMAMLLGMPSFKSAEAGEDTPQKGKKQEKKNIPAAQSQTAGRVAEFTKSTVVEDPVCTGGVKIFENPQFGAIRAIELDGEPWLVGKDVADILGYQNGSRDINRHTDEEDRRKEMVFDGRQNKETIIINESGLYSLVLSSKLPGAKKFRRWVTSEVLPSIRKHGLYATDSRLESLLADPENAIRVFTALKEEREQRLSLENHVAALEERNHALDNENRMLAKETQTWDVRSQLVRLVRVYAHNVCSGNFRTGWNNFYRELYYKVGINLKARSGTGKAIDKILDIELKDALHVAAAMCKANGIDLEWAVNSTNAQLLEEKL